MALSNLVTVYRAAVAAQALGFLAQALSAGLALQGSETALMGPDFAQLSASLGRNLMEGRLGILPAVFEAASTKTWIHMESQ
jgi:hypothetical protein